MQLRSLPKHFEKWVKSPTGLALLEAIFIGCMSGFAAVLLRQGIGWLGTLRVGLSTLKPEDIQLFLVEMGWFGNWRPLVAYWFPVWLVLPLFGLLGGLLSGWLMQTLAPNNWGNGVLQVKAVLANAIPPMSLRVTLGKLVSTIISLGSGLALGRQGPTVEIGSALATQFSRIFPSISRRKNQLIAAGAGSGLAAAFNTPLAGTLFVIEALVQDFSSSTLGTAILASFVGAVVARLLGAPGLGAELIPSEGTTRFFASEIPFYVALGFGSGVLGALFNQAIIFSLRFNQQILQERWKLSLPWRVGLAGLVTGVIVMLLPPLFRDYSGLRSLLTESEDAWSVAPIAFILLFFLTPIAYGSGAPGGIFAPTLILGASLGQFIGIIAQAWVGSESPIPYALAGMGAFFSGTIRAPITAIVIIFELTANFNLILPLMIGVVIAYVVGEAIASGSLYDRLVLQSGLHLEAEKMVIKLTTGQQISLKKDSSSLTVMLYSLGWDSVEAEGINRLLQSDFDLDIAVLCLDENGKVRKGADVIYYGNPNHVSGAISHLGDNMTGEGEGDNEQILINLSQIPDEIMHLALVVTIYECIPRHQTFGKIKNSFVRLVDMEKGSQITRYDLSQDEYYDQTAMIVADVYRRDSEWEVDRVGEGLKVSSLQELVDQRFS